MITKSNISCISLFVSLVTGMLGMADATAADADRGRQVYEQTCVACHGADGTGALPGVPDFTAADGPLTKDDSVLLQHITEGFQNTGSMMAMPAKGGNPELTDEDVIEVLRYIRAQFGV